MREIIDISSNINPGLYSDLKKAYETSITKRNELEIYTINALNSINNYRNFLKYPITSDEFPKYIRMIYKNTYNYEKYKNQIQNLYVINLYCLIIILLSILKNNFIFFDDFAYSTIIGVLLALLFTYIMYNMWNNYLRSNIIYDEYDFNSYGIPPNRTNPEEYDLKLEQKTIETECSN
jgi:hypothetical protein